MAGSKMKIVSSLHLWQGAKALSVEEQEFRCFSKSLISARYGAVGIMLRKTFLSSQATDSDDAGQQRGHLLRRGLMYPTVSARTRKVVRPQGKRGDRLGEWVHCEVLGRVNLLGAERKVRPPTRSVQMHEVLRVEKLSAKLWAEQKSNLKSSGREC